MSHCKGIKRESSWLGTDVGRGKGRKDKERKSQKKGYDSFSLLSMVNLHIDLAIL